MSVKYNCSIKNIVVRKALSLAATFAAITAVQAAPFDWIGTTTSSAWNTAANWSPNTSVPGSADWTFFGVNQTAATNIIDLGGQSILLFSSASPGAPYATGPITNALEFGNLGGVTSWTVQNGSIAPSSDGLIKIDTNVTVNLSNFTNNGVGRYSQLANGATLNIGSGCLNNYRPAFFGLSNATATVNINVPNYSYTNNWYVGAPNTGSTNNYVEDLTVNINANQILPGFPTSANNADVNIGWAATGHDSKLVIRNGAAFSTAGRTIIGAPAGSTNAGNGHLVIGDATTTGYYTNSAGANSYFRVGIGAGTATIDVVNGSLTMKRGETNFLAYGGTNGSKTVINIYTNGTIITAGSFALQTGATPGNAVINFNGGAIVANSSSLSNLFDSSVTVNLLDGGGTIDTSGKTTIGMSAPILNGGTGVGVLTIRNSNPSSTGTGKLTFTKQNTYTGPTLIQNTYPNTVLALAGTIALTNSSIINLNSGNAYLDVSGRVDGKLTVVNNQKLMGYGTIIGNTVIQAGGTLQLGGNSTFGQAIGTLTNNGSLTLSGKTVVSLDESASPSNSAMVVSGVITNTGGATLVVTNLGPTLNVGDTFYVFSQGVSNGVAMTIIPPTGVTLANNLAVDGSIQVLTVTPPVNTTPTNITATVTGGGSTLTLAWPADHTGWHLQIQTNSLSVGLVTNAANWVTLPGSQLVNSTNLPINPANGAVFYRMVYP